MKFQKEKSPAERQEVRRPVCGLFFFFKFETLAGCALNKVNWRLRGVNWTSTKAQIPLQKVILVFWSRVVVVWRRRMFGFVQIQRRGVWFYLTELLFILKRLIIIIIFKKKCVSFVAKQREATSWIWDGLKILAKAPHHRGNNSVSGGPQCVSIGFRYLQLRLSVKPEMWRGVCTILENKREFIKI